MSNREFDKWQTKNVYLPQGDSIVCYFFQPQDGRNVTLFNENHNVFRLDAKGKVIWQVQRDDSIHSPDWWSRLDERARERGMDGAREPFTYFVLKYADGSTNIDPTTGDPPAVAIWQPGCTILLQGSAYQEYVLDPETGIALNVTEGRPRPW
jgi:hypothetical protein